MLKIKESILLTINEWKIFERIYKDYNITVLSANKNEAIEHTFIIEIELDSISDLVILLRNVFNPQ